MILSKTYFSNFIFKMSCLEYIYSIIKDDEKNFDLSNLQREEIK